MPETSTNVEAKFLEMLPSSKIKSTAGKIRATALAFSATFEPVKFAEVVIKGLPNRRTSRLEIAWSGRRTPIFASEFFAIISKLRLPGQKVLARRCALQSLRPTLLR
ncbi:hypothetical protein K9N08_00925 [Candidatus Gracilibacteria bacterium]|nr:hypothetical protein [Candidatus Gracilibacteria bacterium]MCF7856106.1 hypothetical protein [Candidatus Gracilibacteria bacterium]MCF7896525.1 hypothetical protein [Candidatus Gracilibacteria bacterium]